MGMLRRRVLLRGDDCFDDNRRAIRHILSTEKAVMLNRAGHDITSHHAVVAACGYGYALLPAKAVREDPV